MSRQPFLPLFVGDFLAATAEWAGEEQAIYLLLLTHQWSIGSLPADPKSLARLVRWDFKKFVRYWPTVAKKFEPRDGRLVNLRLEVHRLHASEIAVKRADAGRRGAARKNSLRVTTGGNKCSANAEDLSNQIDSTCSSSAEILSKHPSQSNPYYPPLSISPARNLNSGRMLGLIAQSRDAPTQGAGQARSPPAEEPAWFVELQLRYPRRSGSQQWRRALRAGLARLAEGHTGEQILAGAQRYAAFCAATGKTGTEYVQQAATFLGPEKSFLLPWHPPPRKETDTERLLRLNGGATEGETIDHETAQSHTSAIR
jgi:uncharacterized protein YdaU (DUF1376 family)